jgi:MtN3 and saliva related transmembrane protein
MSTRPFPAPSETVINIVGIVSLVSSLLYRFPQIYRTYKTRSAADISIYMLVIQNISYVGYIVYGVLVWDWIYIISSLLSLLQNTTIIAMRRYYMLENDRNNVEINISAPTPSPLYPSMSVRA